MMRGIEFADEETANNICAQCFENGLIIETSGAHNTVVKVLCPLTISLTELEEGLEVLADAVAQVDADLREAA